MRDESVSDEIWWFSPHAEFEDFVDLGEERIKNLVKEIEGRVSPYVINRLLHANKLPHGPRNTMEGPCSTCGTISEEELKSDTERGKLMLLEITDHLDNTDGKINGDLDVKGIRHWVKELQTLLENVKEKTCTLTWREDGTALADCSNCGEGQLYDDYNYCPGCGAKNINHEGETPDTSDKHPDGEVDIPPEASQIGMMHPIDEDCNSLEEPEKVICDGCRYRHIDQEIDHNHCSFPLAIQAMHDRTNGKNLTPCCRYKESGEELKIPGESMEDRECPRCGATWPFEETEYGNLKQPVCPSCGCGIARRKGDPGIVPDGEAGSK